MYLSRRNLIIIISSIAVLLVVVVVLWQFKGSDNKPVDNSQVNNQLDDSPSAITNNNAAIEVPLGQTEQITDQTSQKYQLQAKARLFAEKFGSYSTDNPFANIASVKDLTTPFYQSQLDGLVKSEVSQEFYSVTTRAMAIQVDEESDSKAVVSVNTQRQETVGREGQPMVKYQALELSMVLVNNDWLVNGAKWQE